MPYAVGATVDRPFDEVVAAVREVLAGEGFGIVSEVDLAATLRTKLGVDVPPQVILGACNPGLAHRSLQAEPSIGLLLPCNVVVRGGTGGTVVEMVDPTMLVQVTGNPAMEPIAAEVGQRLSAALAALVGRD